MYEYARKGEEVTITPRTVEINKLEIVNFNELKQLLEVYIECSKGTYIRSIAHDLGKSLGCYAHLINLKRVKAGKFLLNNSISLENLQTVEDVKNNLIYPLEYLDYPQFKLNSTDKDKVSHGMPINVNLPDGITILTHENKLIAISEIHNKKAKISKVFI